MTEILGTRGYESAIESFCKNSLKLNFQSINEEFLPFLPSSPAFVLDLGAGVGQNANALATLGYDVVAVEPLKAFLNIAKSEFPNSKVTWLQDGLPTLNKLSEFKERFSFILLDGVWQHIHPNERASAIFNIKSLLHQNGCCAISLRNGPAGTGKYTFPTSVEELIELSLPIDLDCKVISQNQASKLPNKENVTWSRVLIKHRLANTV